MTHASIRGRLSHIRTDPFRTPTTAREGAAP
jgi:hypothetical protein